MKFSVRKIFWLIFFIGLIKVVLFSHLGFGLLDEGESLHNATRILAGELPYKDFFAIFPPLDNYFFAFIFNIFGKSIIAPRLVMSVIFAFAPAVMFLILVRHVKKIIAIIPPLLMIFLDLNAERLYFFTPIFVGIFLIDKYPFVSGILIGLASLVRADLPGTYLIGLVVLILINKEFIKILKLGFGYLIPIGLMTLWLYSKNLFGLFLTYALERSVVITKLHDLPIPTINFSSVPRTYEASFLYLIIAIYVLFLIRKGWREKNIFISLSISGILALPYVFGRTDMGHIVKGGIPALFLSAYLVNKLKSKNLKQLSFIVAAVIFAVNLIQHVWWVSFNDTSSIVGGYKLRINSSYVANSTVVSTKSLEKSVEFLQEVPRDQKVLALPYLAGVYFLADRQPPTEFNNLLPGFIISNNDEMKFIRMIEESGVKRIVYTPDTGPKMQNNLLKEYNLQIHTFIMENYVIKDKMPEGWLLMERK